MCCRTLAPLPSTTQHGAALSRLQQHRVQQSSCTWPSVHMRPHLIWQPGSSSTRRLLARRPASLGNHRPAAGQAGMGSTSRWPARFSPHDRCWSQSTQLACPPGTQQGQAEGGCSGCMQRGAPSAKSAKRRCRRVRPSCSSSAGICGQSQSTTDRSCTDKKSRVGRGGWPGGLGPTRMGRHSQPTAGHRRVLRTVSDRSAPSAL